MNNLLYKTSLLFLLISLSCSKKKMPSIEDNEYLFNLMSPEYTGIDFENTLVETATENHLINENFVTGAGVAIADINNDGLPDIYFSGNQVGDKLYLNKGNMIFEDITEKAGIGANNTWSTGVTFADVNSDGFQDIYVCKNVYSNIKSSHNLLFINNGDLTFTESAEKYRLNDSGFSIQANFFDFNNDGWLDMYLVNQPPGYGNRSGGTAPLKYANPTYSDKFFRNLGKNKGFVEVSGLIGTRNLAHGLSASVGDVNNDGWQDVYVSNDYDKPDYMYLNSNGTFQNVIDKSFKHISNFSMGSDIADYNNDGNLDIMVVDMVAEDHKRIKTNMGGMNRDSFWKIVNNGWHYQYMFNTLHTNNGNGTFSDLAQIAGVSNTDWSWGPLIADFDNDGFKDIFVTNGIKRNMRYSDVNKKYEKILDSIEIEAKKQGKRFQDVLDIMALVKMAPEDKLDNYIYKNNGDLTFSNKIEAWGFKRPTLSNGASYADLDLDGDLDLIVSNINEKAFVYRNTTVERSLGNFIRLVVEPQNEANIYGTRIKLYKDGSFWQMVELSNNRGYMSKSEDVAHFGLADNKVIEKIEILWPNGKSSLLENIKANQVLKISQNDYPEVKIFNTSQKDKKDLLFKDITNQLHLNYMHIENVYDDFEREVLLPHKMSQFGPSIAVGDVDSDGLEDFYIGGAAGLSGSLFLQKKEGKFYEIKDGVWSLDKDSEDLGSVFFDVDNDGDLDLFVASGGNEFNKNSKELHDRLYLNNGKGVFTKETSGVPNYLTSSGVVEKADFDNDGDIDLFVGGRLVPGQYPHPANSFILENKNGKLVDVTIQNAPDLNSLGMVTSASWVDINNDGKLDLAVVGEWMPITIFIQNEKGNFIKTTFKGLENTEGWYFKVAAADIDNDGDTDLVVGNLGLNYKYKASIEAPFQVHSYDFDKNGTIDIVLSYYEHGQVYPIRGRSCSIEQIPSLAKKFPTYQSFGESNLNDIYGSNLDNALHLKAYTFASYYVENIDGKSFVMHPLPQSVQISSINNIIIDDFNEDNHLDLLISGNLYSSEIETPRNDAGIGMYLKGDGKGNFNSIPVTQSGFFTPYDAKDMKSIKIGNREAILVGNNSSYLHVIECKSKSESK